MNGEARIICNVSGGKDSLAQILLIMDEGIPCDEVVFYDTGMEFKAGVPVKVGGPAYGDKFSPKFTPGLYIKKGYTFWCKEQTDEFGDKRMTASEIAVVSSDRFGKRKLPRNFCPVCGRRLEEEMKDEAENI